MAMSSAVKELLVALKTVVSNFIVAKPIPAVLKKKPPEQLVVILLPPPPLPPH